MSDHNVLKLDDHIKANRDGEWTEIPGTDGQEVKAKYIEDGWLQQFGGNSALQSLMQGDDDDLTAAYIDEHMLEPDPAEALDVDEIRAEHLDEFKAFAIGPIVEAMLSINDLDMYTAGNWKKMERAGISASDLSSLMNNGEAGGSSNSTDSDTDTTAATSND